MSTVKPSRIRLEASSVCQLKCPDCPNTSKVMQSIVGSGFLKPNDFKKLLNDNPWVSEIELSNYGEMFLNPDLMEIIQFASSRNVILTAHNGVNLNTVKENVLEGLVSYKFQRMTCSIDGANNETYKVYRVKGDFETVIGNIKKINQFKKKYRSKYPLLTWQFVVFGHNEHAIPRAKKLAQALDMDFRLKLSWEDKFSPVRNQELLRKHLGVSSRQEFKRKHGIDYMQGICRQLWKQPQINWDGKVLGCCRNFWGDFGGNAFKDGILKSVNSEKMGYARNMLSGKKLPRPDIPCTTCDIYLNMKTTGKWLQRKSSYSLYHAFKVFLDKLISGTH